MIVPQTLKGFRDFLPSVAFKRQFVVGKMKEVFERFGFDPLETPALEYAQTLLGKYGEEADKLLYQFTDNGGRRVGLRYDQTVPAARVVAQYQNLPKPFKRYQIQPVWRAEKPQKGRFREFLQCDADIFGSPDYLADCEIIALAAGILDALELRSYTILINDRSLFQGIPPKAIITIDKLAKIGDQAVKDELKERGFDANMLERLKRQKPTETLSSIIATIPDFGVQRETIRFSPTLARGLEYYTGTIFEIELSGYSSGSICGGGRYDKLIGQFTGTDVPAVGFAFGFDRMLEAMDEKKLLDTPKTSTQVLVTVFGGRYRDEALSMTTKLRAAGINTEVTLSPELKLDKQLKYADTKGIPYVLIQGPDEIAKGTVLLKQMRTQVQEALTLDDLILKLKKK